MSLRSQAERHLSRADAKLAAVIRKVGPWTVEMLLIFTLGRPDVLPTTDYGVRQGVAKVYGIRDLPKRKELIELGEPWRPFRSVASWYFWRVLDIKDAVG